MHFSRNQKNSRRGEEKLKKSEAVNIAPAPNGQDRTFHASTAITATVPEFTSVAEFAKIQPESQVGEALAIEL
jgi:hypothetical protein